jgi:diguanylate cyclase (GGDEF)-like protein
VAKRLSSSIRDSDSVARLGGDEFVVLLDGVQGREEFIATAHKIAEALNTGSQFFGLDVDIAASIGQALFPDDGDDEDALMRAADADMYRIKSAGESLRQHHLKF